MTPTAMNNLRQQRNIDRARESRGGDYPDWRQATLPYQIRALEEEDAERDKTLQRMGKKL